MVHHHAITVSKVELSAVETTPPPPGAAATLSAESRGLRLAGIALLLGCVVGGAALEEIFDPVRLLQMRDPVSVAWTLAAGLAMANGFALGLVLLLVGLRQLSLLRNRQTQRGVIARMAAVNLLLPCVVFAIIVDGDYLGEEVYEQWYVWPALVGYVLLARASLRLLRSGWKYDAPSADELLAVDPRAPVLYLRSFAVDDQILDTAGDLHAKFHSALMYTATVSPEQEMAFIMDGIGPVVAIGRPGEKLPQLGAARRYVPDEAWRDEVRTLIDDAAAVVIRGGETANLWWEVETAVRRPAARPVIIMTLGRSGAAAAFEHRFADEFGVPAPGFQPSPPRGAPFLRLFVPFGQSLGTLIYFDDGGNPHEEQIWWRLTWTGFVLAPYRPYRDSFHAAFRRVFARLNLPYAPKRSQSAAVLLALFGGALGLHHFYMGRRRTGIWHAALFWLAVPMLLGWIDAVRLALLTERQFQARIIPSLPVQS